MQETHCGPPAENLMRFLTLSPSGTGLVFGKRMRDSCPYMINCNLWAMAPLALIFTAEQVRLNVPRGRIGSCFCDPAHLAVFWGLRHLLHSNASGESRGKNVDLLALGGRINHHLSMGDITVLMERAQVGQTEAVEQLFGVLYPELRRMARARLFGHQRNTMLDTTALVHECFLKMVNSRRLRPQEPGQFMAYASRVMRSVIVDFARERLTERRGGGEQHLPLDTTLSEQIGRAEEEVLDVHSALEQLASAEPRLAQVVEMRYFGGMSDQQIAAVLSLTDRTVRRDWEKARAMLAAVMRD